MSYLTKRKPLTQLTKQKYKKKRYSLPLNPYRYPGYESKYFDITTALGPGAAVPGGGTIIQCFNPAQGVTENTRIGNRVTVKSFTMRMQFSLTATTNAVITNVGSSDSYKVVLIQDKQSNGAIPTVANIYGAGATIFAPRDASSLSRFKVLKEYSGTVSSEMFFNSTAGVYACGYKEVLLNFYCPLNFQVTFPTASVLPETNGIYMVLFSENALLRVVSISRIRYSDM